MYLRRRWRRQRIRTCLSNSVNGGIGVENATPTANNAPPETKSRNSNRKRQEAKRENDQRDDPDDYSLRTERLHLFRLWMTDVEHHRQQDHVKKHRRTTEPEPTDDCTHQDQNKRHSPNPPMRALPEGGKGSVSTVELAHRHQVQSRHQQTKPRGQVKRVRRRIVEIDSERARDQTKQKRIIESDSAAGASCFAGDQRRVMQRQHSRKSDRNDHDETRQRSGESNIKQGAA